jgi:DNA polymerase-1
MKRSPSKGQSTTGRRRSVSAPLLAVDSDSFAHRAYHGLPKSIRIREGKAGGSIVGFVNFLVRLYTEEHLREGRRIVVCPA